MKNDEINKKILSLLDNTEGHSGSLFATDPSAANDALSRLILVKGLPSKVVGDYLDSLYNVINNAPVDEIGYRLDEIITAWEVTRATHFVEPRTICLAILATYGKYEPQN